MNTDNFIADLQQYKKISSQHHVRHPYPQPIDDAPSV